MMKIRLLFLFVLMSPFVSFSQMDLSGRYSSPEFDTTARNDLIFRLENNNFFKNDEYFNDYAEGYTLPGFLLQPSLMYYAGSRFRFLAGVQLVQFFGDNKLTDVLPVISARFLAAKNFYIIMGALKGNVEHNLIEPVFDPENQYFRPVENGFQFLYDSYVFSMDLWLDWEQFISRGDTIPEKFTVGFSGNINLTDRQSDWKVSIPLQWLAFHQGGQISDFNYDTYSMINPAGGIAVARNTGEGFIRQVWLRGYFLGFDQFSGSMDMGFKKGWAAYPVAGFNYKYGQFMVGYWHADNFFALKGNPVFQSVSNYNAGYYNQYRDMMVINVIFTRAFFDEQVKFNAGFEGYYDLPKGHFDYSYGMSLLFTPNFKLLNVKSR